MTIPFVHVPNPQTLTINSPTSTSTSISISNTINKLRAIAVDMNNYHINRAVEIHGLMLACLSREHILFLGPPGSNKTNMIVDFNSYIDNSRYFYWLMGQFTKPEELFGPIDIANMKQNVYRHVVTNKLPNADMVILDEPFKASTAILNSLLHIMQERKFENGNEVIDVPLHFIAGAGNELPEKTENLSAMYDRFALRYWMSYIDDIDEFIKLLMLPDKHIHNIENITLAEIELCQASVNQLTMSADALDSIGQLWTACKENKIVISDRRWRKLIKIMKADACYNKQTEVTSENLSVGKYMLWDTPKDIPSIVKLVNGSINPDIAKAEQIGAAIDDLVEEFTAQVKLIKSGEIIQLMNKLEEMYTALITLKPSTVVERVKNKRNNAMTMFANKIKG